MSIRIEITKCRRIRLNKKYGTIYTNFENVNDIIIDSKKIDIMDIENTVSIETANIVNNILKGYVDLDLLDIHKRFNLENTKKSIDFYGGFDTNTYLLTYKNDLIIIDPIEVICFALSLIRSNRFDDFINKLKY